MAGDAEGVRVGGDRAGEFSVVMNPAGQTGGVTGVLPGVFDIAAPCAQPGQLDERLRRPLVVANGLRKSEALAEVGTRLVQCTLLKPEDAETPLHQTKQPLVLLDTE